MCLRLILLITLGAPIKGDREYHDGSVTLQQLMVELPFPTKMISVNMPGKVLQDSVRFSRTEGGLEKRGYLQVDPGVVIAGQWMDHTTQGMYIIKYSIYLSFSMSVYWLTHSLTLLSTVDPVILSVNGQPFSENSTYNVALPRNILNVKTPSSPCVGLY